MKQGQLEVVKLEMARVNISILGISEQKRTRMGKLNSNDHFIYYYGQEFLRRNGVALIVKKRVQNAVLACNLKNDRTISVHFQGKPFSITVIQVYAPITDAIDEFCNDYKITCEQLTYDMLRKDWYRYRMKSTDGEKAPGSWQK